MSEHTLRPKRCPKCGEQQPDTQDWFGEAVGQKAINRKLVAALERLRAIALGNGATGPWAKVYGITDAALAKAKGATDV